MDNLVTYHASDWIRWIMLIGGVVLLYFLLRLIRRVVEQFVPMRSVRRRLMRLLDYLQVLFPAVATAVVILGFIAILPVVHGMVALIVAGLGYRSIHEYVSGLIWRTQNLGIGDAEIILDQHRGRMVDQSMLGVTLQEHEHAHFIPYSRLISEGYSIHRSSGQTVDMSYIIQYEKSGVEPIKHSLPPLLFDSPYLVPGQRWTVESEIYREQEATRLRCTLLSPKDRSRFESVLRDLGYLLIPSVE